MQNPLQRLISVQQQQDNCVHLLIMLASAMMGQLQKHAQQVVSPVLTVFNGMSHAGVI